MMFNKSAHWLRPLRSRFDAPAPGGKRRRQSYRPQCEALEDRCLLSTFSVFNTSDFGPGSLRWAIMEANSAANQAGQPDAIQFRIGSGLQSISPRSALPEIVDPVIIDGTTQPGYFGKPLIEINGTNAGAGSNGLVITTANSTVRGLAINRFGGIGIVIDGSGATGNHIERNYIGTDPTGRVALGNGSLGVNIADGASGNTIGGTAAGAGNVISDNGQSSNFTGGIYISGTGTSGNVVAGNLIGTDAGGTAPLGNHWTDVAIIGGASGNTIGGTLPGARNVISASAAVGVEINGAGSSGNVVAGNFIGTDKTGMAALGNSYNGVMIWNGATGNTIGGIAAHNVISGNAQSGVYIANFPGAGGTSRNVVEGNYIGTDATGRSPLNADGSPALGNLDSGVRIQDASNNTIGGAIAAARNVISGNANKGIYITGFGATRNVVQGNYVGTDATGNAPVPNARGIWIEDAPNNTIGGTTAGARNLVSGNSLQGIYILGPLATRNVLEGNYIGTDATGTGGVPNEDGVLIQYAPNNTVGGTAAGAGNVISGNANNGIHISGAGATGNLIEGNYVGTDATGISAVSNRTGVLIQDAPNNTIGGTTAGARNVISGNVRDDGGGDGVNIVSAGATGNLVAGNYIGTDYTGTVAVANDNGVNISDASNNTIGGATAAARNVVSGNSSQGIYINGAGATQNWVQGNYVGTNASGDAAIRVDTLIAGVNIADASYNHVDGNIVSGSGALNEARGSAGVGVVISQFFGTAQYNTVTNNKIGTSADGTASIQNAAGVNIIGGTQHNTVDGNTISYNKWEGVLIYDDVGLMPRTPTSDNVVQGNTITNNGATGVEIGAGPGFVFDGTNFTVPTLGTKNNTIQDNTITGNREDGVVIDGIGADNNFVYGNTIANNTADGVAITGGAQQNQLGGADSGQANAIHDNGGAGVLVRNLGFEFFPGLDFYIANSPTSPTANNIFPVLNNAIRGNFIFHNVGLSIVNLDLSGAFPNAPVIDTAEGSGNVSVVLGTLDSAAFATYTIDFYSDSATGETYLGHTAVTTDAAGHTFFSTGFESSTVGMVITATATDAAGNTSALSAPWSALGPRPGGVHDAHDPACAAPAPGKTQEV